VFASSVTSGEDWKADDMALLLGFIGTFDVIATARTSAVAERTAYSKARVCPKGEETLVLGVLTALAKAFGLRATGLPADSETWTAICTGA
jgi:hypothetical protein